jgi:hypothetical protein
MMVDSIAAEFASEPLSVMLRRVSNIPGRECGNPKNYFESLSK